MKRIVDELGYVPRTCTWELTLRCNLRCGHCGSRAGEARGQELSRERALEVVGELRALGCQRLTLSGGEPTLSPYWEDVAREGSRLGIRVNMITNGLLPARELVRRAKDAGLQGLGTSLEGIGATHDQNRGRPGLFRHTMDLLEAGHAEGLPMAVVTTLTKRSVPELPALHDLLVGQVYAWQLQIGAAMGHLGDNRGDQIDPEALLTLVPTVAELIQLRKIDIHVADNLGYYGPYEAVLRSARRRSLPCWTGCYAGCRHLGIEADGGVKGCLSVQCTTETEGNLMREKLRDIWFRPGAFAYNRDFRLSDLGGFCRSCQYAETCRGGCLSMRSCEGGRDNPFCYHRVATLAERTTHSRSRYAPIAVAPAALLALLGVGCNGGTTDAYGCPPSGCDADAGNEAGADATDEQPVAPAYGLPMEGGADVMPVDAYGIVPKDGSDPDAQPDAGAVDLYGIPIYAMPPSGPGSNQP